MNIVESYLNIRRLYDKIRSYYKKDPEVAILLARKTTEAICKFRYSTKISDTPNTMTLENLLSTFAKNRTVPKGILTPMRAIQFYGNFIAHDQEDEYEEINEAYARPCMYALETVVQWFREINIDLEIALKTSINDAGFSERTINILTTYNMASLAELCLKVENELLKLRGVGIKTLYEIKEILSEHSLSLGMKFDYHLIKAMSNTSFHRTPKTRRL